MNQHTLRQLYGYYRQAYRNQLTRHMNKDSYDYIENFRQFIIAEYGNEQLFNNLKTMLEPVAWLIEYDIAERTNWTRDAYGYSDIAEFNRGNYRTFCNCYHNAYADYDTVFFGYSCPLHDAPIPFPQTNL